MKTKDLHDGVAITSEQSALNLYDAATLELSTLQSTLLLLTTEQALEGLVLMSEPERENVMHGVHNSSRRLGRLMSGLGQLLFSAPQGKSDSPPFAI